MFRPCSHPRGQALWSRSHSVRTLTLAQVCAARKRRGWRRRPVLPSMGWGAGGGFPRPCLFLTSQPVSSLLLGMGQSLKRVTRGQESEKSSHRTWDFSQALRDGQIRMAVPVASSSPAAPVPSFSPFVPLSAPKWCEIMCFRWRAKPSLLSPLLWDNW